MASTNKIGDLDITSDEAKRLTEALKQEEFRKLFVEYAKELQDPENKKRYEEELAMLEAERGMDVKFVHPEPGYVIKTSIDGTSKAFINICKNEHVGKPEFKWATNPKTGNKGQSWSIPHSFSPPRDDTDKSGKKCQVFDVVFHPDTYRMGESNSKFRKMIEDTAVDGIERQFNVTLDKTNLKYPKVAFKGTSPATVIRSKKSDSNSETENQKESCIPDEIMSKLPYPYDNTSSEEKARKNEEAAQVRDSKKKNANRKGENGVTKAETPKYTMTHREEVDIQNFRSAPDAKTSTRPKELIIAVDLPLLKSAAPVNLDIFEKQLVLESTQPVKYKLDLNLPYPVDENNGSAKFDKSKRRLTVTLPVIPDKPPKIQLFNDVGAEGFSADKEGEDQQDGEDEDLPELEEDDEPDAEADKPHLVQADTPPPEPDNGPVPEPLINGHSSEPSATLQQSSDKDIWGQEEFDKNIKQPDFVYELPSFIAHQDMETTTFVLSVKNVQKDSVSKTFLSGSDGLNLKFISVGSGGFPMYYSFLLQFDTDCLIEAETCDVSISEENVVIVLGKASDAVGIWNKFQVGRDREHLQEALFVTEQTLSSALEQLDQNALPLNNNEKMPDLEVMDMNDDHLTIQLSGSEQGNSLRRMKKFSESSDDIEVVHDHEVQNLHGILKDRSRSMSESSDEVFNTRGYRREDSINSIVSNGSASEGPISESDETHGRKKSVSFSEYVDKTTYRSNASVSMLHASLKSKRRKQRKREAKVERGGQGRRRSSGSEHEHSSEEHSSSQPEDVDSSEADPQDTDSLLGEDSDTVIDHHAEDRNKSPEIVNYQENDAHDEDDTEVAMKQKAKKNKKKRNKSKRSNGHGSESIAAAASHMPPETKGDEVSKASGNGEALISEQLNSAPSGSRAPEVSTISGGDTPSGTGTKEGSTSVAGTNGVDNSNEGIDSDDDQLELKQPPLITEVAPAEADERTKPTKDEYSAESMLSWDANPDTMRQQEHMSKCAFDFSNSMMYDLDED